MLDEQDLRALCLTRAQPDVPIQQSHLQGGSVGELSLFFSDKVLAETERTSTKVSSIFLNNQANHLLWIFGFIK